MALIIVVFGSVWAAYKSEKKLNDTLLLSIIGCSLITYFLGILNLLHYIQWIKICLLVILICLLGVEIKKCSTKVVIFRTIFTRGALGMTVVAVLFFALQYGNKIIDWDDLSHWATYLKQMHFLKTIPTEGVSVSRFNDYQPIGAMMLYWFFSDFTLFPEQMLRATWSCLMVVFLAPFWELLDKRENIWEAILMGLSIAFLPVLFVPNSLLSIRGDSVVATLFLYTVVKLSEKSIDQWSGEDYFANALVLAAMLLAKSVAVLFFGSILLYGLLVTKKKVQAKYVISVLMSFVVSLSWSLFCHLHANHSYISSGFKRIEITDYIHTIIAFIKGTPPFLFPALVLFIGLTCLFVVKKELISQHTNLFLVLLAIFGVGSAVVARYLGGASYWQNKLAAGGDYNRYMAAHYWYGFTCYPFTFLNNDIEFGPSLLEASVILFGLMICLVEHGKAENLELKVRVFAVLISTIIVYMIGHLALYLYLFSQAEASVLSAFNRYLAMPFTALMGAVLYWTYKYQSKYIRWITYIFVFLSSKWTLAINCFFFPLKGEPGELLAHREMYEVVASDIHEVIEDDSYVLVGEIDYSWFENELGFLLIPAYPVSPIEVMTTDSQTDILDRLSQERAKYVIVDAAHFSDNARVEWEEMKSQLRMSLVYADGVEIYEYD